MANNRGHSVTLDKPIEKKVAQERERIKKEEDEVDINSDESFPASDPPSFNPGTTGGARTDKKKH